MTRRISMALAGALALPGVGTAAQDGCPAAGDLGTGIEIGYADGATELYRAGQGDLVTVDVFLDGAETHQMTLSRGVHLTSYLPFVDGAPDPAGAVTYAYADPAPVPAPGDRWAVDVAVTSADGTRNEPQAQAYDAATSLTIGGCTYDAVPIVIAYGLDGAYFEGVSYLPALGFAFLAWTQDAEAGATEFLPVSISVKK